MAEPKQTAPLGKRPRRSWIGWVSAGVVTALVVTLAVVANGFDSRETPREDPSVWVERSAGQYARVNTETAEIDTVRSAESPSGIVQTSQLGLLLTQGFGRAWAIDPSSPQDVQNDAAADATDDAEAEDSAADDAEGESTDGAGAASDGGENAGTEAADAAAATTATADATGGGATMRTPDGTRQVVAAGDFVLFATQSGDAYVSRVQPASAASQANLDTPQLLDPFAEERAKQEAAEDESGEQAEVQNYLVDAAAIDDHGLVALYSRAEQAVRWYDAVTQRWRGAPSQVPAEVNAGEPELAIVGGRWVLFDPATGTLWQQERAEGTALEVAGVAKLQLSATTDGPAYVSDEAGLWRVSGDGAADRVVQTSGVAARPTTVAGDTVAAWVGTVDALLWTAEAGETALELDESVDDLSNPEVEIRNNGSRALVVERGSGMMWTVPDGTLIPVEQWSLVDPPKQDTGTVITQDVTEQEPPVAVNDTFGVRAGEPALLPVLLNDFDPNRKDVLTVVPEGLGDGLDADFGSVTVLSDGQGVLVQPSSAAQGSASFSYRISDGVNVSQPATVALTVVDGETNTAPEWCPVDGCQRAWPSPELAPGGTLIMPILEGWVDPEGDPMMLASATVMNEEDPIRALVTADGKLAIRHTDSNAASGDALVRVRVIDSLGAANDRDLRVRVRSGAAIEFTSAALTAKVGEATTVRPLERVTGGSGSFKLVDAVVQQGSVTVTAKQGTGTVEVLTSAPGSALIGVTVRDTVTEQETVGVVRVTAVESRTALAVPPLRAFVRPLADSTVDVLDGIPGANSRALTVQSATVNDGQLRADVIEHSRVRVSGSTADGQPGRIGSVDVVVTEAEATGHGRLTVFQVADSGSGAIAVTDSATVRAGSVVDIPVLENDVAPPGERLVLHPEIGSPGADGELAFASGSNVRYLAPKQPGEYTLTYTTYGASSPEQSDVGQVRVTVLPAGANRDPLPATITVRVAPGERITATVPLSGVDPDGDRVRLVSVDSPDDAQLSASLVARTNAVQVEASPSAQRGTHVVGYTVRDSFGGEAQGRLRIIVTEPDPGGGAPVVYSDYVRMAAGASEPATVRPLDNDLDPSGGRLELVSVVPNVPGGEDSLLYAPLMQRLDLSEMSDGIVRIAGGDELGTVSFKYTVRSSKSKSTADGLIVVQVSERIGQQAPNVTDTVLSVRDRADFERVGVDVVTDRVRWAAGDASTLQLSLWGSAADRYRVNGSNIVGSYRAEGDLVVFKLSGVDVTGTEVETFGFLVVPPLDELRLSLKPTAQAISVAENKSVDVNIVDLLDLGPSDRVELDQGAFAVQRPQASCTPIDEHTLRYSAGKEAPWSDNCTVRVKLLEQTTYTSLPIAISIVPDDPVVQLNPLTRTVAPGQGETINLTDMVQWQGGREGNINQVQWRLSGAASSFEVTQQGAQVNVQARADAVPGSQQAVTVIASGYGETQAQLTLRVGEAAVDAPRGGTVSLQCTVGSSCSTPLVGVGGEYDPFAGKTGGGLHLVSVAGGGCQFGNLQAAGDSVNVTWSDSRGHGGRCTATFTVRDAQNRTGTGTIEFDAQGVPRAPSSISAVAFTENSVTLEVQLGGAANAHPAVTGVSIQQDGGSVAATCQPSGSSYRCLVGGLEVGERHSFRAVARNSVGDSDPTANAVETWAFRQPQLSQSGVKITQSKTPGATSTTTGTLRFEVSSDDRTISGYRVTVGQTTGEISGRNGQVSLSNVPVGSSVNYSVVPISRFEPPSGGPGDGAGVLGSTQVAGLPIIKQLQVSGEQDSRDVVVTFTVDANGDDEANVEWRVRGGSVGFWTSGEGETGSATLTAPSLHQMYTVTVRASNDYGNAEDAVQQVWVGGNPPALTLGDYTISKNPSPYNGGVIYGLQDGPSVTGKVDGANVTFTPGGSALVLDPNQVGPVTAVQCAAPSGDYCSEPSDGAGWVNAPTTVTVMPNGACYSEAAPPADLSDLLAISGPAQAWVTGISAGTPSGGQIPLTITWGNEYGGQTITLNQATVSVCFMAVPEPDPDPPAPDPGDEG